MKKEKNIIHNLEFMIPPLSKYKSKLINMILDKTTGLTLWYLVHFSTSQLEKYIDRLVDINE